jgi:hypothetical protein
MPELILTPIAMAAVVGAVKGLSARLMSGRGNAVQLNSLVAEVECLRISQEQTQLVMQEVLALVRRVDGLSLRESTIKFTPTSASPTIGDALMNLDDEIEAMRRQVADRVPPISASRPTATAHAHDDSLLEGLDEEIDRLRTSGT